MSRLAIALLGLVGGALALLWWRSAPEEISPPAVSPPVVEADLTVTDSDEAPRVELDGVPPLPTRTKGIEDPLSFLEDYFGMGIDEIRERYPPDTLTEEFIDSDPHIVPWEAFEPEARRALTEFSEEDQGVFVDRLVGNEMATLDEMIETLNVNEKTILPLDREALSKINEDYSRRIGERAKEASVLVSVVLIDAFESGKYQKSPFFTLNDSKITGGTGGGYGLTKAIAGQGWTCSMQFSSSDNPEFSSAMAEVSRLRQERLAELLAVISAIPD